MRRFDVCFVLRFFPCTMTHQIRDKRSVAFLGFCLSALPFLPQFSCLTPSNSLNKHLILPQAILLPSIFLACSRDRFHLHQFTLANSAAMALRINTQTMSLELHTAILTLPDVFIVNGITMLSRDHDTSISKQSSDLLTPLLEFFPVRICPDVAVT
jgi:hypothetical protein